MRRILKPGENCRAFLRVGEAGLLIDGEEYYRAFYLAARNARRQILISGWQFDSEVALLRGADALRHGGGYPFLSFLDRLCRERKDLRVYILAWDFSLIFMLERQWMQEWVFNWSTNERLFFRFDGRHPIGASQHQKFVVIDRAIAFLGGMDICSGRWDDRYHNVENKERVNPDGRGYEPYHDTQAYVTGPLVNDLAAIFAARWRDSTGTGIEPDGPDDGFILPAGSKGIEIPASRAALSLTQAQTLPSPQKEVGEIRRLHIDSIKAAERLVFIENQYLSSYAVFLALMERMEEAPRPKLEVVIILPDRPHGIMEEVSIGVTQSRLLNSLKSFAREYGHSMGVYYPAARGPDGEEVPVYIHSKVLIVDDRFMTIGSANATNRSMGLDSELNISFEATSIRNRRLARSIRRVRASLLAEHLGFENAVDMGRLGSPEGLVDYLDGLAGNGPHRLKRHGMGSYFDDLHVLKLLNDRLLDPERTIIEENLFEMLSPDTGSVLTEGVSFLRNWFLRKTG